jgi:hypothetical protein
MLVWEKARNILEGIGIGNDFLNRTQAAQQLRERMDKWDYMKLSTLIKYICFCITKEMNSATEWEKIFVSYKSDKRLIIRIYRELKN